MPQPQFVDFYKDSAKAIAQMIRKEKAQLPPFMVRHRAMSEDELSGLSRGSFADPDTRTFPICSRAETWHSIAYFNRQVLKQAALSPMSAEARNKVRAMLTKAASLWGLDDDEVEQLKNQVNLNIVKTAEAENTISIGGTSIEVKDAEAGKEAACQFLDVAPGMSEGLRRRTANSVMKAASAVGTELEETEIRTLLQHAGAATCTVGDAVTVMDGIVPFIPHFALCRESAGRLRDAMAARPSGSLLQPKEVNDLVASLESIVDRYNIKNANVSEALRRITPVDLQDEYKAMTDVVKLPGGIMARKTAVAENAETLSNTLHNMYSVTAYKPDDIIKALRGMTPREILPLRQYIGA